MELKIYDKANNLRLTASPNSSSAVTEEIGGECSVSASFTHTAYVPLDVDDYIEIEAVHYKVKSRYRPKQKDTQTYEYSVKFYAPIHDAEDTLMLFQEGGTTSEFSYDGGPREHLQLWIDNMNRRAGGNLWSIGTVITADNKTIEYRNVKCWDAAFGSNGIAATFETEMWADGYVINLCKAERGEIVELGYLQGLTNLAQEDNGEVKFFTRLFPLGSTRNIDATKYGYSRLQLPSRAMYVDKNVDLYGVKEETEEAAFSEIFPKYIGTVSSVRTEEKTNEEGREYTVYYFKDDGMNWNPKDYEIPDLDYMLQFQTGELAGRGTDGSFQAAWHEDTNEWEIINVYPNDTTQIPGDVIIPKPGDTYIPWNFSMPQEYVTAAEQAYELAVNNFLSSYSFDPNKYTGTTDRNYIERNATPLRIGWNVRLLSEQYFSTTGGYKDTRITKVQRKLNDLCQATITCTDKIGTTWKSSVENKLDSLQYVMTKQEQQAIIDIIKTTDRKTPSDYNVFSALCSKTEFLSKKNDDIAKGIILFTKKIGSSVYVEGWDGNGWEIQADGSAFVNTINARQNIFIGNRTGSQTFISGFPNGIGWDIAPYKQLNAAGVEETKYRLEIDDINIRGRLRVYEFIISQLRGENDNVIFAGMMKVDHYDESTRRIYLDTDEGVLYNPFRAGDILMVQRFGGMPTEENDYNVIKQYELRVVEAGIGSLSDGEKRLDWITFSNFVGELTDISRGDVLTRVDSVTDLTRKGIVKITTIDEIGAPYLDVVYGMKTDSENATKARFGNLTGIRTKSGVDLTGIWGIYGNGAYFENSTYILEDGNTIEQEFSIMNGEFNSYVSEIRNNMALEPGNILRNSSFYDNLDYWVTSDSISFWGVDSEFVYANEDFISEKSNVSDIIQDDGKNVLRIRSSSVLQRNQVMNFQPRETAENNPKYSFSLFCKVITGGTLNVGIQGSEELHIKKNISATSEYQKISCVGTWDEQGDFVISFTGEIYIYGVSLFYDEIANATIHLETLINQTSEQIKLLASKEYVDEQTGQVLKSVQSELSVISDEISLKVTQSDIDKATGLLKTELESKISVEAERITAVSTDIDDLNNTILYAGWITEAEGNTLFASKELENGNEIISYINQTATTTTISSNRINLKGAVTYTDLNTSLQDKIDAAGGDALDQALEAYQKALDAYTLAESAVDSADSASTSATNAYQTAVNAVASASNALQAAQDAQTSVDNLPGWSKEKDILTALQDATIVIGGYIATSMIDVDNLYAKKLAADEGFIGSFDIRDYKSLESFDADAIFRMQGASNNFILFQVASSAARIQANTTMGTAIAAISTGTALSCEGKVKFKNLSSDNTTSNKYPLYVNPSSGELYYITN